MAPNPRPKRKSPSSDPTNEPTTKRSKPSTHTNRPKTKSHDTDDEGNQYWEISKMRRVTISEYRGQNLVNIREYYEKDGKALPGRKGISMPIDQYSALINILPEIEGALAEKGEVGVGRPDYSALNGKRNGGGKDEKVKDEEEGEQGGEDEEAQEDGARQEEEEEEEDEEEEEEEEEEEIDERQRKVEGKRRGKSTKSNIEATSDEDEED